MRSSRSPKPNEANASSPAVKTVVAVGLLLVIYVWPLTDLQEELLDRSRGHELLRGAATTGGPPDYSWQGLDRAIVFGDDLGDKQALALRLEVAATQGNTYAQYNLGNMYAEGLGVKRNDAEAMKWYRMAAKQGVKLADGIVAYGNSRDGDGSEAAEGYSIDFEDYAATDHQQPAHAHDAEECGLTRVHNLLPLMLRRHTRIPSIAQLSSRQFKLQYVTAIMLRPPLLRDLIDAGLSPPGRRIYLNLGARDPRATDSSNLLYKHYPDADRFEHHAFEADAAMHAKWQAAMQKDPSLNYYPIAVWNKNTTLTFGIRKSASHVVEGSGGKSGVFGQDKKVTQENSVHAIDFSGWLKNNVKETDYVVLKIDIEGAEFVVLPSLLESGAACLIDEMYLECHTAEMGDIGKHKSYSDCVTIVKAFEGVGTSTYIWF